MNLPLLTTDNISELLFKIVEFTLSRQKILIENIKDIHRCDFVPKDLAVDEFCFQMTGAIAEHIRYQRLVFYDTENIKFGTAGSFEALPAVDKCAKELLDEEGYFDVVKANTPATSSCFITYRPVPLPSRWYTPLIESRKTEVTAIVARLVVRHQLPRPRRTRK